MQSILKRDGNGTKKPLDFAKLDKAYKACDVAGRDRSSPRAGEVGRMAAHYLDWAENQPSRNKLTKHIECARQFLADADGTLHPPRDHDNARDASCNPRTLEPGRARQEGSTDASIPVPEKRSFGDRCRGAVHKGAKVIGGTLTPAPRPDGIRALRDHYKAVDASYRAGSFEPG